MSHTLLKKEQNLQKEEKVHVLFLNEELLLKMTPSESGESCAMSHCEREEQRPTVHRAPCTLLTRPVVVPVTMDFYLE